MDDKDLNKKIQELQILEQTLQTSMMEKQSFQVELNEVLNALSEVQSSSGDIYRIVGGIMVKSEKKKLTSELSEKKKIIDMRIASMEKQESLMSGKLDELKKEVNSLVSKNNNTICL